MRAEAGLEPRMKAAIDELQGLIAERYPQAQFYLGSNPDEPSIVELVTVVDVEDTDHVLDAVMERQMELQTEEGLPLFVVTERPPERVAAMLEAARGQQTTGALLE